MSIEDGLNKQSEKLEKFDSTPEVPTNRRENLAYPEAHERKREINAIDDYAEETREEIVEHYNIPPANVITIPVKEGGTRHIRAYTILENKTDSQKKYYADGHLAHAALLNIILEKFKDEIGTADRKEIKDDSNFFDYWDTNKGFIDPYANGFKNFSKIRSALAEVMIAKNQNGLSEEEVKKFKKNPKNKDFEIPNWFKSA